MRINPYWLSQLSALLVGCGGLALYVVGATPTLRTVGVVICALSLALVVFNLIVEIVRTLRRAR